MTPVNSWVRLPILDASRRILIVFNIMVRHFTSVSRFRASAVVPKKPKKKYITAS